MKHLAVIQTEFSKLAINWEDFSKRQQLKYLRQHPQSKKRLTVEFTDPVFFEDTKESYLKGLTSWVEHEQHHPKLAITVKNFMTKYLPEKFYRKIFTDDEENFPDDIYDQLVKKYNLREYIDQESGNEPEESLAVINEQSEFATKRFTGGEYFHQRIATGIHDNRRMIVTSGERTGLAPVTQDGRVIRKMPYASYNVEIVLGK